MTQEKLKRVVTASAIAGTLLVFCLLAIIIYQITTMVVLDKRIDKIKEENKILNEQIENDSDVADFFESDIGKDYLARQENFVNKDDK